MQILARSNLGQGLFVDFVAFPFNLFRIDVFEPHRLFRFVTGQLAPAASEAAFCVMPADLALLQQDILAGVALEETIDEEGGFFVAIEAVEGENFVDEEPEFEVAADGAIGRGLDLAVSDEGGEAQEGLELLLDLQNRGFKDQRLAEKIIELAEHCGDESTLRSERERLANDFCARKDIEKALERLQSFLG